MTPHRRALSGLAALLAALALSTPGAAKVFHSQKEGLSLAFEGADRIEATTFLLDSGQVEAVESLARAKLDSRIVKLYAGWRGEELLGWAFIDVHKVRTHPEAFLVALDPEGSVRSLRVLAFHEPLDYLPADRWFEQFVGKDLSARLRVGRDVHGVVGATLSTRAVSNSVRRVMALHRILVLEGGGETELGP